MSEASDFASLLFRLAEERNGENVTLTLGGVPVFVIQDADSAHQVLRRSAANFEKHMVWLRQSLGASRFTENGEEWQMRQALSQPYFSRFDRNRAFDVAVRRGRTALRRLAANSASGAVVIDDAVLRDLAAAIMLEVFFDRDLDVEGIDLEDIAAMLRFGSEYSFVPDKALLPFPTEVTRAFLKVRAKVLGDMQTFRAGPAAEDGLLAGVRAMDADESQGFHLEHEMTTFFAAASETTAATLGWAMFLLARNPHIQAALQEALEALPPDADWATVEQVEPLRNFILEVLRMFPSTPIIARKAIAAERVGNHMVEAGEQILISLVGIQHDRRNHPDPWALNIGRAPTLGANSGQSFSFSIGSRMCGGSRFALLELIGMFSVFIREAEFRATSDAPPRYLFQTQLMHEGGQPVSVFLRNARARLR